MNNSFSKQVCKRINVTVPNLSEVVLKQGYFISDDYNIYMFDEKKKGIV